MQSFEKCIALVLFGASFAFSFPRVGDAAPRFSIYSYAEKKNVEINTTGKVTVLISGSVS